MTPFYPFDRQLIFSGMDPSLCWYGPKAGAGLLARCNFRYENVILLKRVGFFALLLTFETIAAD